MARNLLRAGHSLAVYNRSREKAEALAREGARVADTPADACRDVDAAMTMLVDDHALEQIVFGNDGIASASGRTQFIFRTALSAPGFALWRVPPA
jgi:3-hydroxyisobutyrate dehydrogenase-like beta-hydroxyacid dehydrogenase